MRTWGSEVAAAAAKGDLPQLEMGQKFVPFLGAEVAVFLARPFRPATGDEGPMMGDHVVGVDRGVPHGGVQLLMTTDLGRNMRRQARPYRIGHEDSAEVVGSPLERFAGDGELRGLRGRHEAFADVAAGQRTVLGAVPPLE